MAVPIVSCLMAGLSLFGMARQRYPDGSVVQFCLGHGFQK